MSVRPPPEVPGHKQQSVAVIQQYSPWIDHHNNFGNVEKGSVEWVESYRTRDLYGRIDAG